ncbi:MAG TPA: hypothetical protein VIK59_06870 [Verrucomicrobiae bacterium]
MRTKTLLIAAAALVAGIATSNAQVYSQNVVGYVNSATTGGQFALLSNPLDNGTNSLSSLYPTAPNGSQVQVWNGTGFTVATKLPPGWSPNLVITPGEGFFIKLASNATNTFVGSVVAPIGGSVTNSLQAGVFTLIGSPIPYSDTLQGTNLNLSLANGSQVQVWNGSSFTVATKLPPGWSPNLTISVGQGFFVKSATTTNFVQHLPAQ